MTDRLALVLDIEHYLAEEGLAVTCTAADVTEADTPDEEVQPHDEMGLIQRRYLRRPEGTARVTLRSAEPWTLDGLALAMRALTRHFDTAEYVGPKERDGAWYVTITATRAVQWGSWLVMAR